MPRVLLTATSYPRSEDDWQGIFIRRMCDALAHERATELRVWAPPGPLDPEAGRSNSPSDDAFLRQLQNSGGIAHLMRSSPVSGARHAAELLLRMRMAIHAERHWTQVLHINWLQCVIATAGSQTPVLATVLGSDLALLEKRWVRLAVKSALRARKSVICPNAEWMVPVLQHHLGDEQRDILGRSLLFISQQFDSPMSRGRTEAMLSGCCILSSRHDDAERFIENGVNGFLLPDNPISYADTINQLVNYNYKQTLEIGQRGKETALKYFNTERYLKDLYKIVSGVASGNPPTWDGRSTIYDN